MRSATSDLTISTARADALFASPLQRSDAPSPAQVHEAIAAAVSGAEMLSTLYEQLRMPTSTFQASRTCS